MGEQEGVFYEADSGAHRLFREPWGLHLERDERMKTANPTGILIDREDVLANLATCDGSHCQLSGLIQ
jgi:hypothetical protein